MKKDNTPAIDGSALTVLQNVRKGQILTDISAALREVSGAVMLVGKPGCVTIKLNISPSSVGGAMVIADDISTKIPKAPKSSSLFYADKDGNLRRDDPNQIEMQLRTVDPVSPQAAQPEPLKAVAQ